MKAGVIYGKLVSVYVANCETEPDPMKMSPIRRINLEILSDLIGDDQPGLPSLYHGAK